jgi:hypothetical protein
MFQCVITKS